ncbi:MAG TPA: type VI secretion system tube protein TssD [Puia sp.]|jgi:hypothetical protein|nr:type VI secretion system tube protein TssD [Puia sp.]
MPFKVELTVDSQVFPVKDFYLSVLRETTAKGQPSSKASWILDVTIESVNDTTITSWMIDPSKQVDGSIDIYQSDGQGKMKSLEFKSSSCFTMIDRFIPEFSETSCYIRISGVEINVGNVKVSTDN